MSEKGGGGSPRKRFLFDFEVEAHGCLPEDVPSIRIAHQAEDLEVTISNLAVKPGTDRPLLSVQMIIPGDDIRTIEEPGVQKLREYLYYLSFTTSLAFRIHKLLRIIDWTPGLSRRECRQFEKFPSADLPHAVLQSEHLHTIEVLRQADLPPLVRRALRWFAIGLGTRLLDDQFQHFWLALELLAQQQKAVDPVEDLCPKCRTPLYCERCGTHPLHRPYPKQAIEELFAKLVPGNPEIFASANDVRNAIMHGEDVHAVVEARGMELVDVVNQVAEIAWASLHHTIPGCFSSGESPGRLEFVRRSEYTRNVLHVGADLVVTSSDPDDPKLEELAKPTISITISEGDQ